MRAWQCRLNFHEKPDMTSSKTFIKKMKTTFGDFIPRNSHVKFHKDRSSSLVWIALHTHTHTHTHTRTHARTHTRTHIHHDPRFDSPSMLKYLVKTWLNVKSMMTNGSLANSTQESFLLERPKTWTRRWFLHCPNYTFVLHAVLSKFIAACFYWQ